MKDNLQRRILVVFLLVLAILVLVAVTAVQNIRRAIASSDWVNHTHAVILEADGIMSALHAAEAGLRSYVLTGDERDRTAAGEAYAEAEEHLEVATALTRAEPAQEQKFLQMRPMLDRRLEFFRSVVQARQEPGLEAARRLLVADAGAAPLREFARLVAKLKEEENALLRERDKAAYAQAQTTHWTVLTGVVVNFLLLGLAAWLIRDDLAARRRAAAALQEANAQLEIKVKERTAALATANQALQEENLERRWAIQALEHQLRYSQLIINSISDMILVVSKALNITRVNSAVTRRTGQEAQKVIGGPLQRLVRLEPDPTAKQDPAALALKEGRELQNWPAVLIAKDGQTTSVTVHVFPLRDRDKVVGAVVTVRPTLGPGSSGARPAAS